MKNSKAKSKNLSEFLKGKLDIIALFLIFIMGFFLRYYLVSQGNIVFDYDQFEDLFHTKKILFGDFPIIGRPIYGNPNLHHGVLYFYYNLIPFVLFRHNPIYIILWNGVFNTGVVVLIYFFSKSLFKENRIGIISALLWAFSFQVIDFSVWISSTTLTLVTVPFFFYGLWSYFNKKDWGMVLSAVMLGLSIQLEIFFLYLIPTILLFWIIFRPKFPKISTLALSIVGFLASVSTLILTEIKLNFAGVKALLNFSDTFDDAYISFADRIKYYFSYLTNTFSENLFPSHKEYGIYIFVGILVISLFTLFNKGEKHYIKKGIVFLYLYLFSSSIMLIWGFHRQPWFLIGAVGAVVLLSSYVISKLRFEFLIVLVLVVIGLSNISRIKDVSRIGSEIFSSEETSLLSSQLAVVEYTYEVSGGKPFALNSVSYPLYHNALWEYHYDWYGYYRYGYYPGWLGGEQIFPYKTLSAATEDQKLIFFILDNTVRIPDAYREKGLELAKEYGKVVEEKNIGGFTVLNIVKE